MGIVFLQFVPPLSTHNPSPPPILPKVVEERGGRIPNEVTPNLDIPPRSTFVRVPGLLKSLIELAVLFKGTNVFNSEKLNKRCASG